MNICYFGSPEIAASLLELLLKKTGLQIRVVVTQPDRPVGKRLELTATPVKNLARSSGINIFDKELSPETEPELIRLLEKFDVELGIVVAYGNLLSNNLLRSTKHGFWNIHFSLLPSYRGAAPTAYQLILGDKKGGVTLIKMNEKMDQGDIISQIELEIGDHVWRPDLEKNLLPLASKLIIAGIDKLSNNGQVDLTAQKNENATGTRLLHKKYGFVPISLLKKAWKNEWISTEELPEIVKIYYGKYSTNKTKQFSAANIIWNLYRGLTPWPGIWTKITTANGEKRLKINKVQFNNDKLVIEKVQLEGKNEVLFSIFNKSYNIFS